MQPLPYRENAAPASGPRMTAEQLAALGVIKLNRYCLVLQCTACKTVWTPQPAENGLLPRGFWRCPNKCNS